MLSLPTLKRLLSIKLLLPLSWIYHCIVTLRNWLYDLEILKQTSFDIPVISIGNIAVGGTGKTPMIEYLIHHFLDQKKLIAVVSRGYKRKTSGFRIATRDSTFKEIGDESYQIYRKFGDQVIVAVDEDRVKGIKRLLQEFENLDIILLDDAYQHRRVKPQLNILLTTFIHPFYSDYGLPAGKLRESRFATKRADVVIITKCSKQIDHGHRERIQVQMNKYKRSEVPLLFSTIDYSTPHLIGGKNTVMNNNVVLITGIADATHIEDYIRSKFNLIRHYEFRDHYNYRITDINRLLKENETREHISFITTQKDAAKLERFNGYFNDTLYVLPIQMTFINRDNDRLITQLNFFN
ncbi:MAG: tetraacyldisaccharide 4'-kinase [Bacteroidetes bacterium]|nr:tetraacyldisaccharide 4'-kinase [Bacteroidota bacterium]MDA1121635.1 tetraacyldisaccharide 4'-kinase [Bacteroidota bacterium]